MNIYIFTERLLQRKFTSFKTPYFQLMESYIRGVYSSSDMAILQASNHLGKLQRDNGGIITYNRLCDNELVDSTLEYKNIKIRLIVTKYVVP